MKGQRSPPIEVPQPRYYYCFSCSCIGTMDPCRYCGRAVQSIPTETESHAPEPPRAFR